MSIPCTDNSTDSINQAGPSQAHAPPSSICTQCNSQPSKYTCPRCQTKTCSLPCSRAHKTTTGCSGERDRTTYVPMNQYGYSALMNDYVFLEEVGRKVEGWGREIVSNKLHAVAGATRGMSIRGRGMNARSRGRGMSRVFRHGHDKRSYLAMQLSIRDIEMDVLPHGMKRASQNMSVWDGKGKRALLTIELVFEPPPDPFTREVLKSTSLISNKNDWDQTIRRIIKTNLKRSQKARDYEALLQWLSLEDEDETVPTSVLCLMKRPRTDDDSLVTNPTRPSYYKLDWNQKLSKAFRYKHFVEFPTIIVTDETSFSGILVDDSGATEDLHERQPKRRKLDVDQVRKTMSGLVGDYGSEDEEEANVLETLANYSENDEDDATSDQDVCGILGEADEEHADYAQDTLDTEPAADNLVVEDGSDDETLDWGDEEIAEDEAKIASLSDAIRQRYATAQK
ncbi:uncharacterized protein FOMMEDRAFT_158554 [Fomitiporia mediterranea MF3/22]|uniref:uncharacterized protein n=1 Tax=Fomitiporia mediterranea (strain MF3/22) TaxID=694068 RepID=UPI0004408595|nr:uncharacterized protein FOMMEDRAFT_158554 [Fomitiporia mediterranea MF3/22]EJD01413.1 hypothetical protein FOMMEDRAFT_158554 [Fomitiporia mediterranea MF3/22]